MNNTSNIGTVNETNTAAALNGRRERCGLTPWTREQFVQEVENCDADLAAANDRMNDVCSSSNLDLVDEANAVLCAARRDFNVARKMLADYDNAAMPVIIIPVAL